MEQEKKLIKKTAIYAVGNIGSKFLAYIMVLVYSNYVLAEDLGYYDLILTTVSMVHPLIMFQISDGVYRFLIDSDNEVRKSVLATSFKFLAVSAFCSEIILAIISAKYNLKYSFWIMAYLLSLLFYMYFHDAIRGLGQTKKYAIIGIVNSIILLVVELVGLVFLDMGVLALLAGNVISMAVCIVIMIIWQTDFHCILQVRFDKNIFSNLIKYSAPLVPNTVCWWIVNSSDRYIILAFLGTASNGIYAISNKFPTILTTITGIFYLAWQEAAIKEYNSTNRDAFFSAIFKKYYTLLFSLCLCAIPMTHIVIETFVGTSYKTAWRYSGFLYLGAAFSALCSFLGLGYQISKETHRTVITTVFAALINIFVNIGLVKLVGLHAASFSTFIAYFFLFIIRTKHTKKYFTLNVSWNGFYLLLLSVIILLLTTITFENMILSGCLSLLMIAVAGYLNRNILLPLIKKYKRRLTMKRQS